MITIVPDDTPLVVEATLSNDDIGYARVGQKVDIKVDTYPFQKYGVLSGTLVWISADAEPRNATSDSASSNGNDSVGQQSSKSAFAYRAHIRADRDSRLRMSETNLLVGMTVPVDIKTDRRRVIEFLLSPVVKYADEGIKVR